ncbi:YcxB family protein [Hespellia stercorisuis]|uniref:YcxB-like protein n=1 Tax=Hespellia stercorisuis DSM 15480 TaxID=1121950 RepID=A0A1M6MDZ4_9FIRM|nr:YcxB family protein [Hespellia stercorisuis]SHJ81691.1 YcxB-like protein [Hespellia stercorisuis DSM 15480]
MEEKLTVQLTEDALFDFILYHTYSKFAGFLVNILGTAVIFMGIIMLITGKASPLQFLFYLVAGIAFLLYTPIGLKRRAKKQMNTNPEFRDPKEYTFCENGIRVCQETSEKEIAWDQIEKVVATPKTIGVYYESENALIIPKQQFGDKFMKVMNVITAHVSREKIKIR